MIKKSDLYKRICDVEDCDNTQTYEEYIREAEKEFGFIRLDLDYLTEEELNKYINQLDDLALK